MKTPATLQTQSDWELLREYTAAGSEAAFSALVHRHLNLVYSVAFRYCSDRGMAEEVANNVFSILARKASTLKKDIILLGWLFNTARYAAANARGFQKRRRQWEEQAAEIDESLFRGASTSPEGEVAKAWEIIAEQLDTAVAELHEADRHAILLRFYENKSLREIGVSFGISEEAARKRTTRALEKLRKAMVSRGVVCPAATLGLALSTYSAQSAPAGMASAIAQAAGNCLSGPAVTDQAMIETVRWFQWRLFKYAVLSLFAAGLIFGGALFFWNAGLNHPGPREVFLRQMQAVQNGDGEAYAQTLRFSTPEERATRPVFVDSVRLRFDLRTNLVQRFGTDAFSQSKFPLLLDVVDANRLSKATESIQGKQAVVVAPWGSRLPFVRQQREWKLDYFKLPGISTPVRYGITAAQRNGAIAALAREVQAGIYLDVDQAYDSIQQKLKRSSP
jgi:RNA polymerase sigma factor (sigma-70 family)